MTAPAQTPTRRSRRGLVIVTAAVSAIVTTVGVLAFVVLLDSASSGSTMPPDPTGNASRGCIERVGALYFTVEADPANAKAHTISADALFSKAGDEWASQENQNRHLGNDSNVDAWCRVLLQPVRP